MASAQFDITIEQGTSFSMALNFNNSDGTPIDISLWTFTGQIRSNYSSPVIIQSFSFSPGASSNQIMVSITAANTALIPVETTTNFKIKSTYYSYDIIATKPDQTIGRYLEGAAIITPTVTR